MVVMEYLSNYTIYNEVIDGMKAMGISRDELAANLQMNHHQKSGKCEISAKNLAGLCENYPSK